MKRTWTIIGVSDVPASFKWYQSLFGQPETRPGHDDFGQILDSDGTVLLCLHQWGVEEHPSLMRRDEATPGNGLLLFFRVDDFDRALQRARTLVVRFEEEPHANPNTQTQEFSLRDPDGYYVTISAFSSLEPAGHEPPATSDITPELVADELEHQLMPVTPVARPILLEAIANLISKRVVAERARCRALCEHRAELWRNTKGAASPLEQEARFRANEATYLADLLQ